MQTSGFSVDHAELTQHVISGAAFNTVQYAEICIISRKYQICTKHRDDLVILLLICFVRFCMIIGGVDGGFLSFHLCS